MAKTVKWPRLSKRAAAALLHVHYCTECNHAFQRSNASCASCRPMLCAACAFRQESKTMA